MGPEESQFAAKVRSYSAGETAFGRFRLDRIVGRGGMGVVWLAWDTRLEREIALKFLPEKLRLDEKAIEDLRRETRRCLSLTHPNIVRTYDFHVDEQTAAMAMEYVDGETLTALRLRQPNQVFMPSQLLEWFKQVSEALTYAYRHEEVVHLDLKPANLMVDVRGQLKITDFGIASTVTDSMHRISPDDDLCGSPPYMSPQQIMGEPPSVSDDIYSLGVTLYELLTSKPPFYGANVLQMVMQSQPVPVSERRAEMVLARGGTLEGLEPIPVQWETVIARCLAKAPPERPRTVADIIEGLLPPKPRVRLPSAKTPAKGSVQANAGAQDTSTAAPTTDPAPVPNAARDHRRRNLLLIILLLLGLGLFFWAAITAVFSGQAQEQDLREPSPLFQEAR